jgi:hypothetical protein
MGPQATPIRSGYETGSRRINIHVMKTLLLIPLAAFGLTSCDVKVDNSDPPSKSTTIVTPGKEEKKVENNTTIVNPPKEEKKVENKTTIINPPAKVEKKETTIINPPPP